MRYAEQHGKRRWGEKTPLHTWHVDDMARVFPDAQFIGVVRHPYGTIASNMTRFKSKLARATWQWAQPAKELVRQAERLPGRFVIVRYEELVTRPEPVLRELLEWLGEPWSPAVLEHHAVQGGRGGPTRVEGHSRADDPIDETRVAKWTTAHARGAPRVVGRAGRPARRLLRLRARRPAGARAPRARTGARCCARRS